jgi:hypothetical protein
MEGVLLDWSRHDRVHRALQGQPDGALDGVAGELVPLFRLEASDPTRTKYAIVLLTARIPAGEVRFEDVRDQLRRQLGDDLARRKYLDRLRKTTYVEVRDS